MFVNALAIVIFWSPHAFVSAFRRGAGGDVIRMMMMRRGPLGSSKGLRSRITKRSSRDRRTSRIGKDV